MQASNAPSKISVPFADTGAKEVIPVDSQIGVQPGRASYEDGFPPVTRTPIAAGGVPPFGTDFNGIFYAITNLLRWQNSGGTFTYDAALSTAIGGYPAGAVLLKASGTGLWFSTVDDNTTDPDAGGAGWVDMTSGQNIAVFDTAGVTEWTVPAVLQAGILKANVTVIGGGGGGSRSGAGSAVKSEGLVDLTGVASVTVTVGAGGIGTDETSQGGSGESSSFGAYVSAAGSPGGFTGASQRGGGGTTGAGDVVILGAFGESSNTGGAGGSIIGSGPPGFGDGAGSGSAGVKPGDGGAGGKNNGVLGGNGYRGIVIVRW